MSKYIQNANTVRKGAWQSFKNGIRLPGYAYYEPPKEVMYRYPAPGSNPLDEDDHPNLYKNDWKLTFRDSEYNISTQEQVLEDEDPRQA